MENVPSANALTEYVYVEERGSQGRLRRPVAFPNLTFFEANRQALVMTAMRNLELSLSDHCHPGGWVQTSAHRLRSGSLDLGFCHESLRI